MKQFFKIIWNICNNIWSICKGMMHFGYFLAGIAIIFSATYLFSYPLLVGEFKGNDTPWAMTMVGWINRWWPNIPLWFPLQGGGMNIILGYPVFGHLLTVLIYRLGITGLSLFQIFRLFQFLAVPLAAISVYFFVWIRFKNQTVAFISSVFTLLSAAIWFWLTHFGFYAQSLSFMFFPLTFLCLDGYLEVILSRSPSIRQRRFWLIGTAIFFALATFTHLTTGVVLGGCLFLYTFFVSWGRGIIRGIQSLLFAIILGLGIIFFWFAGFLRYFAYAGRDASLAFAPDQLRELSLDPLTILGLKAPGLISMWDNLFFARVVIILGGVGLIWSFFRQKKVFYLGLIAIVCAFFTTIPQFAPELVAKYFLLPYTVVYVRALIGAMLFFPILAGFGAYAIPDIIGLLLKRIFPKDLLAFLLAGLTLAVAFYATLYLRQPPPSPPGGLPAFTNYSGYGPPHGEGYKGYIVFEKEGQLPTITWPEFKIDEPSMVWLGTGVQEIDKAIGAGQGKRIDISPYAGGYVATLNLYSDHSTINAYAYGNSLIHSLWGYQAGAFYSDLYGEKETISNLSKWFGIQAVVLSKRYDPLEKFSEDKWNFLLDKLPSNSGIQVQGFKEARPMAELSSQPLILVVGDVKKKAYETVFRLGMEGVFSFDKAWLIDGGERIDKFSLEDFQKYDGVFLYGYQYRHGEVWDRLQKYVSQGGNLFIETGWEEASLDREREIAPDIFPITGTKWGNLGKSHNYSIEESFVSQVDISKFGPLVWSDQPWGLSLPKGVRNWAQPILKAEGEPLIVGGKFGEGYVLWSGMNFIGHLRTYEKEIYAPKDQSKEEMKFFMELMDRWLISPNSSEAGLVRISRDYPDKVLLNLPSGAGGRMLLWREAYHPDWRARFILKKDGKETSSPAKILLAGPWWMGVYIPEDKQITAVELTFGIGLFGFLTLGLTVLFWLIIGLIFLDGLFKGSLSAKFHLKENIPGKSNAFSIPNFSLMIRRWWRTEDDKY